MKIVIIDDEKRARNLLHILLEENCPEVNSIDEAEDLPSGVKLINKVKPDIVFLDIEMPGYSGLQLLDFFDEENINFEIIFATAYSEYAIKAFQLSAIDYLLKPLRPQLVKEAIEKAKKKIEKKSINSRLENLKSIFQSDKFTKIALPVSEGVLFVNFDQLICCEAEGMYTNVHTTSHGKVLISKPLKYFTDILKDNQMFYRPHRSFLINLNHVEQYIKKDGGYILMNGKISVTISRDKKEEFLTIISTTLG